jgi:hypothetical protein
MVLNKCLAPSPKHSPKVLFAHSNINLVPIASVSKLLSDYFIIPWDKEMTTYEVLQK